MICGVISDDVNNFNVSLFIRELYSKLKDHKAEIPQFNANNSIGYAIYQMTRWIQLNPELLMLSLGIEEAWKKLNETYYTILELENNFLNPILVLQSLISIQVLPPLYKEMFTELEWVECT